MAVEKQTDSVLRLADVHEILRCDVGSNVHGVSLEGSSDHDEMGICIEPPEYVIGLRHFEQFVIRDRPDGVRSQPGDTDLVVYGLRKFCSLALKGNPSILLMFNVPPSSYTVYTDIGRQLRDLAWAFASRKAGASFLGYMQQQRQRLMGERGQMNVKRPELVNAYGFDTKYASHIIRLGYQGIEYMDTGSFTVPMPEQQRAEILAIRTGSRGLHEVLNLAGELEQDLKTSIDSSPLADEPRYDEVNHFLVRAYGRAWGVA